MKYIIIGNGQEWCYYSWKASLNNNEISFYNGITEIVTNPLLGKICNNLFCRKNPTDNLPLIRRIWYPRLVNVLGLKKKTCTILFYDYGLLSADMDFLKYIKKKCPQTKLIFIFTNISRLSGAVKYGTIFQLSMLFDQVFAFEPTDVTKYKFDFTPLIYQRAPEYKENEKSFDVFYVGNAKDRLDTLHNIYKECMDSNLTCCFYINGVPREKQLFPGIHYNSILSYKDVLSIISRSRCIVDAIQGESTAMTIKVCEAVVYDKKLITTNESIKKEPYYSPNRIHIYKESRSLKSFIEEGDIEYTAREKHLFSPEEFFKKIRY